MKLDRQLPKNYKFANNLRLVDAYRLFKAPSRQRYSGSYHIIPPLSFVNSAIHNFNLRKEKRTFIEAKRLVEAMDLLLDQDNDGSGKALKIVFNSLHTWESLNNLSIEAQKRFVKALPNVPKATVRHRAESMKVFTAMKFLPHIHKNVLKSTNQKRGRKRKLKTTARSLPTSSSSSSSSSSASPPNKKAHIHDNNQEL